MRSWATLRQVYTIQKSLVAEDDPPVIEQTQLKSVLRRNLLHQHLLHAESDIFL